MKKIIQNVDHLIYVIRGQKVMLDEDLAKLYGVETRTLNQAVNRNKKRFPEDFMFKLTEKEFQNLTSQIVISKLIFVGLLCNYRLSKKSHVALSNILLSGS